MRDIILAASDIAGANLVLCNANIVNVFSGEIMKADVVVRNGMIAGVGDYAAAVEMVDLSGKYLLPGFIDAHIHIESSLLTPGNFAAVAVPRGTTAVVADPHEIVNVAGFKGLAYMSEAAKELPLNIFYTIPSCVPATNLETSGAIFGPEEIAEAFRQYPESPALGEMMNYPGVCQADADVLKKIAVARQGGKQVDGHAPMLRGGNLCAYVSAGIRSDHESVSDEEALEKVRLGMQVLIREGSAAHNLLALLPAVNSANSASFSFCSDDRHSADLISEGEMDNIIRRAVAAGLDAVTAVRMATINTARHYRLNSIGAIAPGYHADMVVVNNLDDFQVEMVYKNGRLVAENGRLLADTPHLEATGLLGSVHLPDLSGRFILTPPAAGGKANVIQVLPDQIVTKHIVLSAEEISADGADVAKVAIIERHGKNGNIALGFVKGFGLRCGALASSIAHDSHNVIVIGVNDTDMELAAKEVGNMHGGLAVVANEQLLATLPLPVGGLMSNQPASVVATQYEALQTAVHSLGCTLPAPFMTMSFLALPVIPEIKITDRGLFDVSKFEFIDLWE